MSTRIANAVVILVGLMILAYPLTVGATPNVSCRGASMKPGDRCVKADGESTQTYEQRATAARNAKPVIFVVGALVAAFGSALLIAELRHRGPAPAS